MENHTNNDYKKPTNLVEVEYHQTGKSKKSNELGMREMQENIMREHNKANLITHRDVLQEILPSLL